MDASMTIPSRGLAVRWVEVTDGRGRPHLEMRWATPAPAAVGAVATGGVAATPTPHAA